MEEARDSVRPDSPGPSATSQTEQSSVQVDPPRAHDVRLCGVCNTNPPKYKCPRCYLPYCSVACNKTHRENHPPDPEPAAKNTAPPPLQPISSNPASLADTKNTPKHNPIHRFGTLESSRELQYLFRKYPRLPQQLLDIHAATLAPEPEKSKIPASLLKDLPQKGDQWDREKGISSGKEALRKARKLDGVDGEAIREYSELVLHLLNDANSNR